MEILNNLETTTTFDNGIYFKIYTVFWLDDYDEIISETAFEFRESIHTDSSCLELWDNTTWCWAFIRRLRDENDFDKFIYDNQVSIPATQFRENKDEILANADEHYKFRTVLFNHFRK